MSALNDNDPELYGYIHSTAWDVNEISRDEHWQIADAKGEWTDTEELRIEKHEQNGGLLKSLLTNPVTESRQAAQAAVETSVSLMSRFWGDFKKVCKKVKVNTKDIKILKTNQEEVQEKQKQILGRIEILEKQRKSDIYAELVKKIGKVEGQIRILSKNSGPDPQKKKVYRKHKISKRSVEDLIRDNNLEKASYNSMINFLKKKQRQQVLLDGKPIVTRGRKSELLSRIRKLIEKPEERVNNIECKEIQNSQIEKRKEARKLRALKRQQKKQQVDHLKLSHQREQADEDEVVNKKRKISHADEESLHV